MYITCNIKFWDYEDVLLLVELFQILMTTQKEREGVKRLQKCHQNTVQNAVKKFENCSSILSK